MRPTSMFSHLDPDQETLAYRLFAELIALHNGYSDPVHEVEDILRVIREDTSRESAVIDAIRRGITDPSELRKYLKETEQYHPAIATGNL